MATSARNRSVPRCSHIYVAHALELQRLAADAVSGDAAQGQLDDDEAFLPEEQENGDDACNLSPAVLALMRK